MNNNLWQVFKNASLKDKPKVFFDYCNFYIEQKNKKILREEEVAYKICSCTSLHELSTFPGLEAIIDHACDIEIPRESSYIKEHTFVNGIWNKEKADKYKEEEFEILLSLIKKAKSQTKN
jgi:hypothetical protein